MTLASNDFAHLHTHSEFSLLDGLGRVDDLAREASALRRVANLLADNWLEQRRLDDAMRTTGMTELEEAELTEGQGRALSGHKTAQSYRGYANQ